MTARLGATRSPRAAASAPGIPRRRWPISTAKLTTLAPGMMRASASAAANSVSPIRRRRSTNAQCTHADTPPPKLDRPSRVNSRDSSTRPTSRGLSASLSTGNAIVPSLPVSITEPRSFAPALHKRWPEPTAYAAARFARRSGVRRAGAFFARLSACAMSIFSRKMEGRHGALVDQDRSRNKSRRPATVRSSVAAGRAAGPAGAGRRLDQLEQHDRRDAAAVADGRKFQPAPARPGRSKRAAEFQLSFRRNPAGPLLAAELDSLRERRNRVQLLLAAQPSRARRHHHHGVMQTVRLGGPAGRRIARD